MKHIIVMWVFKLMKGLRSPERTNSVRYCKTLVFRGYFILAILVVMAKNVKI